MSTLVAELLELARLDRTSVAGPGRDGPGFAGPRCGRGRLGGGGRAAR